MIGVVAKFAVASVAIYFLVAILLIVSQRPRPATGSTDGIDFGEAIAADYSSLPDLETFRARDGASLSYRRYDTQAAANRLIVLIHGSAWHGMQFHAMATRLRDLGLGTVIVPDMRGHGENPQRRGDIDYIGQLEDDVADLVAHVVGQGPKPRLLIGGHSSGGGFVLRLAGSRYGRSVDAFVLLAPFLKYNAPTTRPNSGGWAAPATRRIIGLTMLNSVGQTFLNHLPVISFAMPGAVLDGPYGHTATTTYSYRMLTGFGPHADYEADLQAITQPLLVVAGEADESFRADLYQPTISPHVKTGSYKVLPGVTHLGVVERGQSIETVAEWISGLSDS